MKGNINKMIVELKPKGTLVLPKELVKELRLSTGEKMKIEVVDGVIRVTPVYVVPKKVVKELQKQVNNLKKEAADQGVNENFEGLDAVIEKIEEK